MVRCLRMSTPDCVVECDVAQSSIADELGGSVTFVGEIPQVQAYLVARRETVGDAWPASSVFFPETEVHGEVFVIASDDEGAETDLNVAETKALLREAFKKKRSA